MSHLLTQGTQEEQLNVNFRGNLTLERVHRDQSGIYGCRVEDYDAGEDVQLVKSLELRVACERFGAGGAGGGLPTAPLPQGPHPPRSRLPVSPEC